MSLKLENVEMMYSGVMLVLKGVSMEVRDKSIVALLGANGAGKTSTLKCISGIQRIEEGEVTRGHILYDGEHIERLDPTSIVKKGIIQVLEGRAVLEHLTVEQNLLVGSHLVSDLNSVRQDMSTVYSFFPALKRMRQRTAGYLSGGEQQMLVIGRAIMGRPKLMILDEPSLGLAPLVVREIFEILRRLNQEMAITILLVEQNVRVALSIASYGYVMENGRIVLDGTADELGSNEDVKEFYLGLSMDGRRRSYRDVKHYKRRKRWLG